MASSNKEHDKIVSLITDIVKIDRRVVDAICRYSFKFKANVIRNPIDKRPIRDRYLGVFAIREAYKKSELVKNDNTMCNNDDTIK
jgi:hypothetical protein